CGHRCQRGPRRRPDRVRTRPGGHADRRPLADPARRPGHADALGARGGHRLRRGLRSGVVGQAALRCGRPGRGRGRIGPRRRDGGGVVSGKKRRRPNRPRPAPVAAGPTEGEGGPAAAPEPRRPFGGALFGSTGESVMPPVGRSLGRGLLAIVSSPVLLAIAILVPLLAWLALYAIGFEGRPALLVDVLALPPIATYFDLGT